MAKKILVVDDEADLVDMVQFRLQAAGYTVEVVYNGEQCLEKVKTYKPNLILLDIMMPKMDGVETAQRLHADDATKKIPIIAFTAKGGEDLERDLEKMSVIECVRKPFDPDDLVNKVKSVL